MNYEGTHIKFVYSPEKEKERKTMLWWVVNKHANTQLGWIGWFAKWRKYAFYPQMNTVYEEVCLKEIADFIKIRTQEHKGLKIPTR